MNISENENEKKEVSQVQQINVNIKLVKNITALLEIATSRGTFKANELSSVGRIYDELSKLLQPTSN